MTQAESMTDELIQSLINTPKIIESSKFKKIDPKEKNGNLRFDVDVDVQNASFDLFHIVQRFWLFSRMVVDDPTDFSVGLCVEFRDSSTMKLMRCNGLYGGHINKLDKQTFDCRHVHMATKRYIEQGYEAEAYAEPTDEYIDSSSAFEYLRKRCNISIEGMELFDPPFEWR